MSWSCVLCAGCGVVCRAVNIAAFSSAKMCHAILETTGQSSHPSNTVIDVQSRSTGSEVMRQKKREKVFTA